MEKQRKKYGQYFITIGLEIHVALKTEHKLFSSSFNEFESDYFALLDAGVPGVLPVLNPEPVKMAMAFALSVGSRIEPLSMFERKHYFYPDLPLGYQITQQHQPIMTGGQVSTSEGMVLIEHAHLECDAAKSLHEMIPGYTAIDLSRCASPLLEIVSTPCIYSSYQAKLYAKKIHSLVSFLGICDGKMEEGSFRVDASISLCEKEDVLGTRVEIKNISSFSFLETALEYEIIRQAELLDSHQKVEMETRLFNEKDMATHSMRSKETVAQYRYMPDPDLPALIIDEAMFKEVSEKYSLDYFSQVEKLSQLLLPLGLDSDDSMALLCSATGSIWQEVLAKSALQQEYILKLLAFWLPEAIAKSENKKVRVPDSDDLSLLADKKIAAGDCKKILLQWLDGQEKISHYFPKFMDRTQLNAQVRQTLSTFTEQVQKYQQGESKMIQFLIGKIMSQVKGQASAIDVRQAVEEYCQSDVTSDDNI